MGNIWKSIIQVFDKMLKRYGWYILIALRTKWSMRNIALKLNYVICYALLYRKTRGVYVVGENWQRYNLAWTGGLTT